MRVLIDQDSQFIDGDDQSWQVLGRVPCAVGGVVRDVGVQEEPFPPVQLGRERIQGAHGRGTGQIGLHRHGVGQGVQDRERGSALEVEEDEGHLSWTVTTGQAHQHREHEL